MPFKSTILLCLALSLIFSCAQEQIPDKPQPAPTKEEIEAARIKKEQEASRIKKIFENIDEKNRTLKKTPEWLTTAYSSIKIKKLNDIPKEEYASYKKYLNNGEIYIVMHPGYHAFFVNNTLPPSKESIGGLPSKNVADRLSLEAAPDNFQLKIMQEQERLLRDFLEFMSEEKKLVILILPNDYKNHLTYGYVQGLDEYARYVNELTNMSESILYMESQTHDTGTMAQNELDILSSFFSETGTKRVYYSGGFIGRCLDNFNTSLTKIFEYEKIYFVPELSSIAPFEINSAAHSYLLNKEGKINFRGVIRYFASYGAERVKIPKIRRFQIYNVYSNREAATKSASQ